MKRLLLLLILLCVNFDTVLNAQTGTYRIKRGGAGFNLPAPEGYIPVGVGGTSWVLALTDCVLDTVPDPPTFTCAGAGGFYATIQNEGTPLTQRAALNFIGSLVNCADDAGNARTNCTFTNPSAYATVEEEGSALTQRSTINFVGSSITCADSGGKTVCTLTAGTNALLDGTAHTDTTNSAVTRGDLIIGNSTPAWDDLAVGAAHTVLTSDGTDPSWQTAIPIPSILDPTLGTFLFDDFIANVQLTAQITSGLGWDKLLGSGTVQNGNSQDNTTSAPPNSEFHPGVLRLQTAGTASGRAAISLGGTVNAASSGMMTASGGVMVVEWLFQMYDLSSSTQRFRIQLGIGNNWASNAIPFDAGFWVEYTDNVNTGKFEYKYLASGSTDTVDSGLTAAADTWYKVRMVTNANWSEVTYTINGANSQTINGTNDLVNTDAVSPGAVIIKSVGTTSRELIIDYFRLYQIFSTARQ